MTFVLAITLLRFTGFAGPVAALLQNDAGTWSQVPEPIFPIDLGVVLFFLAIRGVRKRRLAQDDRFTTAQASAGE